MVHLFDIVRRAQGGSGLESLGGQFGLNFEQTQRAVDALLPAFSLALRHAAYDPASFGRLLEHVVSGRYAPFFDGSSSPAAARTSASDLVTALFGSDEASRRVAEQASAATGLGTSILHQMLPMVAAVIVGGMFRLLSAEGLADALQSWSDWLRRLNSPAKPPASDPAAAYRLWLDGMSAVFGGSLSRPAPPPPANPDPWSAMFAAWTGSTNPVPKAPPPDPKPFNVLAGMFETGREVQVQYAANLQSLLDGLWANAGARPNPR